jgi:hypothetical protein
MQTKAGGDIQSFLSRLPGLSWAKYPGEKHTPQYQYCGPSTRLDIRLDANDKSKPCEEPINRVGTYAKATPSYPKNMKQIE